MLDSALAKVGNLVCSIRLEGRLVGEVKIGSMTPGSEPTTTTGSPAYPATRKPLVGAEDRSESAGESAFKSTSMAGGESSENPVGKSSGELWM